MFITCGSVLEALHIDYTVTSLPDVSHYHLLTAGSQIVPSPEAEHRGMHTYIFRGM